MKLGFIGTGEITKAVVIGILGSKLKFKKIYLSERNKKISSFLRKKINQILFQLLLLNFFPNLEDEVQPYDLCYQFLLHLHNS